MIAVWLHRFFADKLTETLLLLIALDLVLGIVAAFNAGKFRLSYVSDFLRNDVLGKVVPFFVVYGGYLYAKHTNIVIPGIDLVVVKDAAWGFASLALIGSLLSSLRDLGILKGLSPMLAGPDPATPEVPVTAPVPPAA